MKISQIEKELTKIYDERNKWNGGKGPFTNAEIRRRELILLKQYTLYYLEDAICIKSPEKGFWFDICKVINKWLKEIEEEQR